MPPTDESAAASGHRHAHCSACAVLCTCSMQCAQHCPSMAPGSPPAMRRLTSNFAPEKSQLSIPSPGQQLGRNLLPRVKSTQITQRRHHRAPNAVVNADAFFTQLPHVWVGVHRPPHHALHAGDVQVLVRDVQVSEVAEELQHRLVALRKPVTLGRANQLISADPPATRAIMPRGLTPPPPPLFSMERTETSHSMLMCLWHSMRVHYRLRLKRRGGGGGWS